MVFFSTGCFKGEPATKIAQRLSSLGVTSIELSAGEYDPYFFREIEKLKKQGLNLVLHNYYPVPKKPFVMNLASAREDLRSQSIELALQAIEISASFELPYYGVHAGMRVDPSPSELGNRFRFRDIIDEKTSMSFLIDSLNLLNQTAKGLGVELLIENHVSNFENLGVYGENVFLLSSLQQLLDYCLVYQGEVRLLLDVGHLKVSSNSLGFDKVEAFKALNRFVGGYHLHDNDGLFDQHNEFDESAWFIPLLSKNVNYVTCELNDLSSGALHRVMKSLTSVEWEI